MSATSHETAPGSLRVPRLSSLALALVLFGSAGCEDGIPTSRPGDAIHRDAFIEAMVELRWTAMRRPTFYLAPSDAEMILEARGLTPDEMERFVEVHGRNIPFMYEVWSEVEQRLAARATPEPSAEPLEPSPEPPRP